MKNFTRLSIRIIAVGKPYGFRGQRRLPIYASIYWKSVYGMNGTIHVDGVLRLGAEGILGDTIEEFQTNLNKAIYVCGLSDSSTEARMESLRTLESAARAVHFSLAGTDGQTVDEATIVLLKEVVAPVVIGETVILPAFEGLANALVDAFVGALERL